MFSSSRCIVGRGASTHAQAWPLYSIAQSRSIEQRELDRPNPKNLVSMAGAALARLTLAYTPHCGHVWIMCGPGNNGADGLAASVELKRSGKRVTVSMLQSQREGPQFPEKIRIAVDAGIEFSQEPPPSFDAAIDALFGIGGNRALPIQACAWVRTLSTLKCPVIAADVPSGLDADTGLAHPVHIRANATLGFLTLKPGMFTANGRDSCGDIWLDTLGVSIDVRPTAWTNARPLSVRRWHASHKGTFGDVCIFGGALGMKGAALLAGEAALQAGAGRVFVGALDANGPGWSDQHPELMFKPAALAPVESAVVVAGCGGGPAIEAYLPALLQSAPQLVLDADALNHIAANKKLRQYLKIRKTGTTILTPHPLEAARLLSSNTTEIQENRLEAARTLSDELQCVVVLKGSGTIVASPDELPRINLTGNASLATAGTGDVLAGYIGGCWAQGRTAYEAANTSCFMHGLIADEWPAACALTAGALASRLYAP